jgi:hypothetical protein
VHTADLMTAKYTSMENTTIACNKRLIGGGVCGEVAVIGSFNAFYQAPKSKGVVRETHYHVRCPNCGPRVQVVPGAADAFSRQLLPHR